jgi:hypothetical protein
VDGWDPGLGLAQALQQNLHAIQAEVDAKVA